jgi:hypothetical protein
MSAAPPVIITETLGDALYQWGAARELRGKDISDTLAKAMRYWVSFALAKVPRGSAEKIRSDLTRIVQQYKGTKGSKGKVSARWRGTLAALLVFKLNWKGDSRDLARARSPQFFVRVSQFVNARAYGANLHRAGFLPALSQLPNARVRATPASDPGRMPKYRHQPGLIDHTFSDQLAEILVENFASAAGPKAAGISGLAGDAFDTAAAELFDMISSFLLTDLMEAAAKAGFEITVT